MDYKVLNIDNALYPQHLRSIPDAPERLFYIGDISLIQTPAVAMVGTRHASPYGKWVGYEIAKKIAGCGIPIVSGMAYGIDTVSHRGCLDKGTGTIAVLGSGIDVPYPKSNNELYKEICKNGLVISEFGPGTPPATYTFPQRNRIISGLASKVIIVEGAFKSGSMITARYALDQGREVFAVPGNINQPNSTGVNQLIADGAPPITELDKVLEILGISESQLSIALCNLEPNELKMLEIIRDNPGITVDDLSCIVYEQIGNLSSFLCSMELKNIIRRDGNRLYYS